MSRRLTLCLVTISMLLPLAPFAEGQGIGFVSAEKYCGGHTDENGDDCTFSCSGHETVSVEVIADDKSSWTGNVIAIGHAECGGAYASCSEKDRCYASDKATDSGDGKCHGETEEKYHNGFTLTCQSRLLDDDSEQICQYVPAICATPDPDPSPPNPECAAFWPMWEAPAPLRVLEEKTGCPVAPRASATPRESILSEVRIVVHGDAALAQVCNLGHPCWFVVPTCEVGALGRIRSCEVGPGVLVLEEGFKAPDWF